MDYLLRMHTPDASDRSSEIPSADTSLDRRLLLGGLAGLAGVAAMAQLAKAGPLTPPAGPVASTGRTLTEIEPRIPLSLATAPPGSTGARFVIIQPGSYYLTGNLTGDPNRSGIVIRASNVSIDLCGFNVQGVPNSSDGIVVEGANRANISITNGHITGWGASGISLFGGARNIRISHITTSSNGGSGIFAQSAALITHCIAASNTSGFDVTSFASISNCIAHSNLTDGIRIQSRCHIVSNLSTNNAGSGFVITGFGIGGNRLEANTSALNLSRGYSAFDSSGNIFLRNIASANTTNWVMAAGNFLQVLVAQAAPAFNGLSGGTPLAPETYDPNANFSY
jgi:hypothetical protein